MKKHKEISTQELIEDIGKENFDIATSYILEYFDIAKDLYPDSISDLKILKPNPRLFYILENTRGYLLITVKKNKEGDVLVLPTGVARHLSDVILEKNNAYYDDSTVYYSLLHAYGEYNNVEPFCFFIGVLAVDQFNFDPHKSSIKISNTANLYISGMKEEFYLLKDQELYYSKVWYNLTIYPDKHFVKAFKTYGNGGSINRPDDKFEIPIDSIIESALNEFRTSKE